MGNEIQRFIEKAVRGIKGVKDKLNNHNYQNVEELRQLDLEIDKLKEGMEAKKKQAMDPNTSPQDKIILLREIEEQGKLLEQKLAQLNNILNFDASSYVRDFV